MKPHVLARPPAWGWEAEGEARPHEAGTGVGLRLFALVEFCSKPMGFCPKDSPRSRFPKPMKLSSTKKDRRPY